MSAVLNGETEDQYIERVTGDLARLPWREKDNPEWVRHWQGNMRLKYRAQTRANTERYERNGNAPQTF